MCNNFKFKSRIFVKQYAKVLVFGQIYELSPNLYVKAENTNQ